MIVLAPSASCPPIMPRIAQHEQRQEPLDRSRSTAAGHAQPSGLRRQTGTAKEGQHGASSGGNAAPAAELLLPAPAAAPLPASLQHAHARSARTSHVPSHSPQPAKARVAKA